MMSLLSEYDRKRDFHKTREPWGRLGRRRAHGLKFVIQEHHASHLHYDFRLEWEGVLKSWAVPKGPSTKPGEKRLAVQVEDHPVSYGSFEGKIPEGEYGAGQVYQWDNGTWEPIGDAAEGLRKGHLEFVLHGKRLEGKWMLVRTRRGGGKPQWLLIKRTDQKSKSPGPVAAKTPKKNARAHPPEGTPKSEDRETDPFAHLTSKEKPLFREPEITKLGLAKYYLAVAPLLLPHLANRPIALLRCPDGAEGSCFFQKHRHEGAGRAVATHRRGSKAEPADFFTVDSGQGLVSLVQRGAIELHVQNGRLPDISLPDQLVMDFDPGPGVPWAKVKQAALHLKEILAELRLESFLKTTGGKGLHVHVPIAPVHDESDVRSFARALGEAMVAKFPGRYTVSNGRKERAGKIFVDYLRNGTGALAIVPYGVRARRGAPIAWPLAWSELKKLKSANGVTLKNFSRALRHRKDPWRGYANVQQRLPLLEEKAAA